uniref:CSON004608 protein n=1 Tax=Culicoides sonorensis TaxID=179676 RepID=A0A336LFC0_CULSO
MEKSQKTIADDTSKFQWTSEATTFLLDQYMLRKHLFSDKSKGNRELWDEIVAEFGKQYPFHNLTFEVINRKFRNMKTTFIGIKNRMNSTGNFNSKWEFLEICEEIFGDIDLSLYKHEPKPRVRSKKKVFEWSHDSINLLLQEFLHRVPLFEANKDEPKVVWNEIKNIFKTMGHEVTTEDLAFKFMILRNKYFEMKEKLQTNWGYYEFFEKIFCNEAEFSFNTEPLLTPKTELIEIENETTLDFDDFSDNNYDTSNNEVSEPPQKKARLESEIIDVKHEDELTTEEIRIEPQKVEDESLLSIERQKANSLNAICETMKQQTVILAEMLQLMRHHYRKT